MDDQILFLIISSSLQESIVKQLVYWAPFSCSIAFSVPGRSGNCDTELWSKQLIKKHQPATTSANINFTLCHWWENHSKLLVNNHQLLMESLAEAEVSEVGTLTTETEVISYQLSACPDLEIYHHLSLTFCFLSSGFILTGYIP